MTGHSTARRALFGGIAIVTAFLGAQDAHAQEFELRAVDLRVVGDARWSGGGWGGYHPIRLEITNFGEGRDLELKFEPHDRGEGVPTVRRRVRVEQNATARLSLAVPLVGGNSGRFEILIGGEPVEGLRRDLSLMPRDGGGIAVPSLLAITADAVDWTGFQQATLAASQEWNARGVPPSHVLAGGRGAGDTRYATLAPALLPASWVDYTAVDLVAVPLDTLAALRPEERSALLDWAATGGRLIVHRVGASPAESEELRRLLGDTAAAAPAAEEWRPADPAGRRTLTMPFPTGGMPTPNEGDPLPFPIPSAEPLRMLEQMLNRPDMPPALESEGPRWEAVPAPFAVRRIGFGQLAAVSDDLFTGTGSDWAWLLRALHGPTTAWPIRNGLTSGDGAIEFINLPIPGVRGVPSLAFLSLITLFAIAIGPANYFLLWRKRKLSRLVLTVPAVAAATSVLLFGYAAVAHGFGTKGRVRSLTLIDPATNKATSVSRIALFSGLAPSRGLSFSKETAVFPLLPHGERFSDGEIDWTEAQGLTAGWLKTRTRTQFVTMTRRDERGRLTVTPSGKGLRVVNGFSVPISHLVATGPDGKPYSTRNLAAGGEATLKPLGETDWATIRELALARLPEPPPGVEPEDIIAGFGGRPWMWYQRRWQPEFRFGLLERHLARLVGPPPGFDEADDAVPLGLEEPGRLDAMVTEDMIDPLAAPRGYLALAAANPGIDLGGLAVEERDSVHMLIGRW